MRGTDRDARPQTGAGEVRGVLIGDEASGVDRHHMTGRPSGLLGILRGVQNRATLIGVGPEHPVQPVGFPRAEPFRRFVEDQRVRVAEQCGGECQSAIHAQGERADALVPQSGEADGVEQGVGPGRGHSGSGTEHAELSAGRAGGVPRHVAEQDSHFPRRVRHTMQWSAPEVGDAASRLEFEHQPQGRGLAGAGRAQQCGDTAGSRFEREVVHGGRNSAVAGAGESDGLEHRFSRRR